MPKKRGSKPKTRSTAKSRRLSKALKKYWARVHQIQKYVPELTLKEARSRDRELISQTVARGIEKSLKAWRKVGETKTGKGIWREIDPKKRKEADRLLREEAIRPKRYRELITEAVRGPRRSTEHVKRSRAQISRWELIYRTARRFQMTPREASKFLTRMREEMQQTAYRFGKRRKMRLRDAAYVAEWTDRYESVRLEFGL